MPSSSKRQENIYLIACVICTVLNGITLWKMAVTTCFAFSIEAMVRGYHVYQSVWEAVNGEVLECSREIGNRSDPYAVAVMKSSGEAGGRIW